MSAIFLWQVFGFRRTTNTGRNDRLEARLRSPGSRNSWAFVGMLVILSLAASGCGPNRPPKNEIVSAMAELLPAHFKLLDTEVDFTAAGENNWLAKAKLQIAPKEDLFITASPDPKVVAAAEKKYTEPAEIAATRTAAQARVLVPAELYNQYNALLLQWNRLIRRASGDWIKPATKAGNVLTVYGSSSASYEFKAWKISNTRLEQHIETTGTPRSAFGADILVVGSPQAAALADEISQTSAALDAALVEVTAGVDRLVEAKRRDDADVLRAKEQAERDRHKTVIAAVAKGRRYEGTLGNHPIGLEFIESNEAGTIVRARIYNPQAPKLSRLFSGGVIFKPYDLKTLPIQLSPGDPVGNDTGGVYVNTSDKLFLTPTANGLRGNFQSAEIDVAKVQ